MDVSGILTRNPDTDGGAALVTWGFPEVLQRSECCGRLRSCSWAAGDLLAFTQVTPASVCPLGVPASTGLPHRESRLTATPPAHSQAATRARFASVSRGLWLGLAGKPCCQGRRRLACLGKRQ